MTDAVLVLTTVADDDRAEPLARTLIEERLAACVNLHPPMVSIYRWKGATETADEVAAIFKTSDERVAALMARIAELHSYDVPCVAAWPVDKLLGAYADWVEDSVSATAATGASDP